MTTPANLDFTGERYVPNLTGQIRYEHLHRYAIAARIASGRRVLDVACGEGYGSALLAREAAEVVGVDTDERSIRHARASYFAPNLRFAAGSCTELPLGDGSVDVVASFETIEHLVEHERMLDEIRRVLAPGGVLVMSSPNRLVYSDLAGFTNPFHARELYFADFRELVARRFAHLALYGQRVTALSVVHPLASAVSERPLWYSGDPAAIRSELPALPQPMYFIAVASDHPIDLTIESAFLDPADDLLEDMWVELNTMRRHTALAAGSEPNLIEALPGASAAALPAAPASAPAEPSYEDLVRRLMELEQETQRLRLGSELHERRAEVEFETATRLQTMLHQREAEIAEHAAELAEHETRQAEHAAQIARHSGALSERDAELARHAAALSERDRLLAERDAELVQRRAELAQHAAALSERDALLAQHDAQQAQHDAQQAQHDAQQAQHADALAERDALLAQRDAELAQQAAALAAHPAELDALRAQLAAAAIAAQEQRAALTEAVDECARERAAREALAAAQRIALGELERELRTFEERAAVAERRLTESLAREAAFAGRLEAAEAPAAQSRELEEERSAHRAQAARHIAENAALRERVAQLERGIGELSAVQEELARRAASESELLQDVLSSRSWRLTYPLRAAGTVLRGRAGRA